MAERDHYDMTGRIGAARVRRRTLRRAGFIVGLMFIVCSVLALVLLSPLLLGVLSAIDDVSWARLSEVGQTYGAVSALVSALALGAVAMSLFIQARQARASEIQGVRAFHLELIRMELDDLPTYLDCWGPLDLPDATAQRRHIYTNLMFSYAWMGFDTGEITESLLQDMLGGMFRGPVARRYWTMARHSWVAGTAHRRHGRRFIAIVDDEYGRAVASEEPTTPPEAVETTATPRQSPAPD